MRESGDWGGETDPVYFKGIPLCSLYHGISNWWQTEFINNPKIYICLNLPSHNTDNNKFITVKETSFSFLLSYVFLRQVWVNQKIQRGPTKETETY